MKILQVSKFYPPVMGGIESVAWELTEGLNRTGMRADVLCSNQVPHNVRERSPGGGYEITRAASWGMLLSTSVAPAMVRHLRRLAGDHDVIHVHMPDPMAAFALWAARPQARVVVHWHSDVIRQRLAMRVYAPLQRWLLMRADAVIATSRAYADASEPLRSCASKVHVIPIGISDNMLIATDRRTQALRQRFRGRRIVFSLGRMTYYKGFDVLIEAAGRLPKDCVLLIGGDGELLDPLRKQVAQRGLAGKVQLLGHIHDDELASYFMACDVFCMSSTMRAEAYGVAMLEAMVMGKPIVATRIDGSGVPWVNVDGETGLNVPVGDPEALAGALQRLLADPVMRQRMGAAARQRYLREFNAGQMVDKTLALYRGLVASGPASTRGFSE